MGFVDALKRPFSNLKTFGIGTILLAIPIVNFLAGLFLISGFGLQAAKKTFQKDNSLPEWGNWGQLVKDSLKVLIAQIVYMIPFAIIAFIIIGASILQLAGAVANPQQLGTAIAGLIGGVIILIPLAIIYAIIADSAIMHIAQHGNFTSAFAFGEVLKNGFRLKFIIAIIKSLVALIIFGIPLILLIWIPIINLIAMGAFEFAAVVSIYTILAEGYE